MAAVAAVVTAVATAVAAVALAVATGALVTAATVVAEQAAVATMALAVAAIALAVATGAAAATMATEAGAGSVFTTDQRNTDHREENRDPENDETIHSTFLQISTGTVSEKQTPKICRRLISPPNGTAHRWRTT